MGAFMIFKETTNRKAYLQDPEQSTGNPGNDYNTRYRPDDDDPKAGLSSIPSSRDIDEGFDGLFINWISYTNTTVTAGLIRNILMQAETGWSRDQAMLIQSIREHEPIIEAHLQTRIQTVLSVKWSVQDTAGDAAKADFVQKMLERAGLRSAMEHLLDSIGTGYAGSLINWMPGAGGILKFSPVHPANWIFDMDGNPAVVREDGSQIGLNQYHPYQFVFHKHMTMPGIPSRGGLVRSLVWTYFYKHYGMKHRARYLEKYGIPFMLAKLQAQDFANESIRAKNKQALRDIGADGIGVFTEGSDITTLSAGAQGANASYQEWFTYLDQIFTWLILGQLASSDKAGGFSNGQTQDKVRNDLFAADCQKLMETVQNQIIYPLEWYKFHTSTLKFKIEFEPPEDMKEKRAAVKELFSMGFKPKRKDVEAIYGIPLEEEATAKPGKGLSKAEEPETNPPPQSGVPPDLAAMLGGGEAAETVPPPAAGEEAPKAIPMSDLSFDSDEKKKIFALAFADAYADGLVSASALPDEVKRKIIGSDDPAAAISDAMQEPYSDEIMAQLSAIKSGIEANTASQPAIDPETEPAAAQPEPPPPTPVTPELSADTTTLLAEAAKRGLDTSVYTPEQWNEPGLKAQLSKAITDFDATGKAKTMAEGEAEQAAAKEREKLAQSTEGEKIDAAKAEKEQEENVGGKPFEASDFEQRLERYKPETTEYAKEFVASLPTGYVPTPSQIDAINSKLAVKNQEFIEGGTAYGDTINRAYKVMSRPDAKPEEYDDAIGDFKQFEDMLFKSSAPTDVKMPLISDIVRMRQSLYDAKNEEKRPQSRNVFSEAFRAFLRTGGPEMAAAIFAGGSAVSRILGNDPTKWEELQAAAKANARTGFVAPSIASESEDWNWNKVASLFGAGAEQLLSTVGTGAVLGMITKLAMIPKALGAAATVAEKAKYATQMAKATKAATWMGYMGGMIPASAQVAATTFDESYESMKAKNDDLPESERQTDTEIKVKAGTEAMASAAAEFLGEYVSGKFLTLPMMKSLSGEVKQGVVNKLHDMSRMAAFKHIARETGTAFGTEMGGEFLTNTVEDLNKAIRGDSELLAAIKDEKALNWLADTALQTAIGISASAGIGAAHGAMDVTAASKANAQANTMREVFEKAGMGDRVDAVEAIWRKGDEATPAERSEFDAAMDELWRKQAAEKLVKEPQYSVPEDEYESLKKEIPYEQDPYLATRGYIIDGRVSPRVSKFSSQTLGRQIQRVAEELGVGGESFDSRGDLGLVRPQDETKVASINRGLGTPEVKLGALGLVANPDMFAEGERLPLEQLAAHPVRMERLQGSGEADVLLSRGTKSVYKAFSPTAKGEYGIKLVPAIENGKLGFRRVDGDVLSVLEKLRVMSAIGGIPSQVMGMTKEGMLIVKQPLAKDLAEAKTSENDMLDKMRVVGRKKDVLPFGVTVIDGEPYAIADLNPSNIRVDNQSDLRIIDPIVGKISQELIDKNEPLAAAVAEARKLEQDAGGKDRSEARFRIAEPVVTPERDAEYLKAVEAGDTEAAQRMVDEAAKAAGYNVGPVWHGADPATSFSEFRPSPTGAIWFNENRRYASFHSIDTYERGKPKVMRVRLDIRNPLDLRQKGGNQWNAIRDNPEVIASAKRDGHDGIVLNDDTAGIKGVSWVAFSPSQIKSADPVTRDDQGRVIPLSKRFNNKSEDIRYSLGVYSAWTDTLDATTREAMRKRLGEMAGQDVSLEFVPDFAEKLAAVGRYFNANVGIKEAQPPAEGWRTLFHETEHAVEDLALSQRDKDTLTKLVPDVEDRAKLVADMMNGIRGEDGKLPISDFERSVMKKLGISETAWASVRTVLQRIVDKLASFVRHERELKSLEQLAWRIHRGYYAKRMTGEASMEPAYSITEMQSAYGEEGPIADAYDFIAKNILKSDSVGLEQVNEVEKLITDTLKPYFKVEDGVLTDKPTRNAAKAADRYEPALLLQELKDKAIYAAKMFVSQAQAKNTPINVEEFQKYARTSVVNEMNSIIKKYPDKISAQANIGQSEVKVEDTEEAVKGGGKVSESGGVNPEEATAVSWMDVEPRIKKLKALVDKGAERDPVFAKFVTDFLSDDPIIAKSTIKNRLNFKKLAENYGLDAKYYNNTVLGKGKKKGWPARLAELLNEFELTAEDLDANHQNIADVMTGKPVVEMVEPDLFESINEGLRNKEKAKAKRKAKAKPVAEAKAELTPAEATKPEPTPVPVVEGAKPVEKPVETPPPIVESKPIVEQETKTEQTLSPAAEAPPAPPAPPPPPEPPTPEDPSIPPGRLPGKIVRDAAGIEWEIIGTNKKGKTIWRSMAFGMERLEDAVNPENRDMQAVLEDVKKRKEDMDVVVVKDGRPRGEAGKRRAASSDEISEIFKQLDKAQRLKAKGELMTAAAGINISSAKLAMDITRIRRRIDSELADYEKSDADTKQIIEFKIDQLTEDLKNTILISDAKKRAAIVKVKAGKESDVDADYQNLAKYFAGVEKETGRAAKFTAAQILDIVAKTKAAVTEASVGGKLKYLRLASKAITEVSKIVKERGKTDIDAFLQSRVDSLANLAQKMVETDMRQRYMEWERASNEIRQFMNADINEATKRLAEFIRHTAQGDDRPAVAKVIKTFQELTAKKRMTSDERTNALLAAMDEVDEVVSEYQLTRGKRELRDLVSGKVKDARKEIYGEYIGKTLDPILASFPKLVRDEGNIITGMNELADTFNSIEIESSLMDKGEAVPVDILDSIRSSEGKSFNSLSTEQITNISNAIKRLLKESNLNKQNMFAGRRATKDFLINEFMENTQKLGKQSFTNTVSGTIADKERQYSGVEKVLGALTGGTVGRNFMEKLPKNITKEIDGTKDGILSQLLIHAFDISENIALSTRDKYDRLFKDKLSSKGLPAENPAIIEWSTYLKGIDSAHLPDIRNRMGEMLLPRDRLKIKQSNGNNITITVAQAIDIYNHARTEDGRKALINENGVSFSSGKEGKTLTDPITLTGTDINKINIELHSKYPDAIKFADAMYEMLQEEIRNDAKATFESEKGFAFEDVKGGYWPMRRINYHEKTTDAKGNEKFKEENSDNWSMSSWGHFMSRIKDPQASLVIRDGIESFDTHRRFISNYVGYAKALREAKSFLNDSRVKNSTNKWHGKVAWDTLKNIVIRTEGSAKRINDPFSTALGRLKARLSTAVLPLSATAVLSNYSSYPFAWKSLGGGTMDNVKRMTLGTGQILRRYATGSIRDLALNDFEHKALAEMDAADTQMGRRRTGGFANMTISEANNASELLHNLTGKTTLSHKLYFAIRRTDAATMTQIAMDAFNMTMRDMGVSQADYINDKLDPAIKKELVKKSASLAWKALKDGQPLTAPKDNPEISNTANHPVVALFDSFVTPFRHMKGRLDGEILDAKLELANTTDAKERMAIKARMTINIAYPFMVFALFDGALQYALQTARKWNDEDDENEKNKLKETMLSGLSGLSRMTTAGLLSVPMITNAIRASSGMRTPWQNNIVTGPVLDTLNSVVKNSKDLFADVIKWNNDEITTDTMAYDFERKLPGIAGFAFKLPLNALFNTIPSYTHFLRDDPGKESGIMRAADWFKNLSMSQPEPARRLTIEELKEKYARKPTEKAFADASHFPENVVDSGKALIRAKQLLEEAELKFDHERNAIAEAVRDEPLELDEGTIAFVGASEGRTLSQGKLVEAIARAFGVDEKKAKAVMEMGAVPKLINEYVKVMLKKNLSSTKKANAVEAIKQKQAQQPAVEQQ